MSRCISILLSAVVVVGAPKCGEAAECYNVTKGEPASLTGKLEYAIFPRPPNFQDVQKGDTPEPTYVLQLPSPICITGDDFSDPQKHFQTVQIVESDATSGQLRGHLHQQVTLTLEKQMAAETGHHHEPLVAWVTSVKQADARPLEFTDEYGTGATAIRAFYAALGDGQGEAASLMIAPEKRTIPAFSAQGLTQFYGALKQPIKLIDIAQSDRTTFVVHYQYATVSRLCDARAVVTVTVRSDRNFIQSIKPLNGC